MGGNIYRSNYSAFLLSMLGTGILIGIIYTIAMSFFAIPCARCKEKLIRFLFTIARRASLLPLSRLGNTASLLIS